MSFPGNTRFRDNVTAPDTHEVVGTIHLHSVYSDGSGTVDEILAAAEGIGLDFLVLTDHNSLDARAAGYEGWHGSVLLIVGDEVSSRNGHCLALGTREHVNHRQGLEQILRDIEADILAARYSGTSGEHTAVYFESEQGRGGYFRPDGTSVQGAFLQAPLRHARISSRYSHARLHPILKVTRPHHGIDYAAPHGEPIWAVADGKVIYRSRAGGFGNLVKVRHANGYVSYYSHLSAFANDLRVGDSVQQKQVIGFVGSTGLATGPHVCFRIAKDGKYMNPARMPAPAGPPSG